MDGQVARPVDREVSDLLDQFVCVRIVEANFLDLTLFQFDGDLSWACFFLDADRTLYARYGTNAGDAAGEIDTLEGFKKAARGALALHKAKDRKALAGKLAPKPEWALSNGIPENRHYAGPAHGRGSSCMHCHEIGTGIAVSRFKAGKPLEDRDIWPFPPPDALGLVLDPAEEATVSRVTDGSPAAKAGFRPGDRILRMEGQPILSIADVQWVLERAPEPGKVKLEVARGEQTLPLVLEVPKGWRQGTGWRDFIVHTYGIHLVGFRCSPSGAGGGMALKVRSIFPSHNKTANLAASVLMKKDDVITGVDGIREPWTEYDFLLYLLREKKAGEKAALTVLRAGKTVAVQLPLPK